MANSKEAKARIKETKQILFSIMNLFFEFKKKLKENHKKIYSADLVEELFSSPVITPVFLAKRLDIHYTTASKYLRKLKSGGFLSDAVHGKYHFYANKKLIKLMHDNQVYVRRIPCPPLEG